MVQHSHRMTSGRRGRSLCSGAASGSVTSGLCLFLLFFHGLKQHSRVDLGSVKVGGRCVPPISLQPWAHGRRCACSPSACWAPSGVAPTPRFNGDFGFCWLQVTETPAPTHSSKRGLDSKAPALGLASGVAGSRGSQDTVSVPLSISAQLALSWVDPSLVIAGWTHLQA